eukprot:NODE_65_length_25825_cov_1.353844.p18 type:complete len:149 gc:universal NODE_65_length_25825_cov_1.353844:13357-13803(+)
MAFEFLHCGNLKNVHDCIGLLDFPSCISINIDKRGEYLILANDKIGIEIPLLRLEMPLIIKLILQDHRICKLVEEENVVQVLLRLGFAVHNYLMIKSIYIMCGYSTYTMYEIFQSKFPEYRGYFEKEIIPKQSQFNFGIVILFNLETA